MLAAVIYFVTPPHVRLASTEIQIDISTRRIRKSTYILFTKVSEQVRDSPITKALLPGDLTRVPEWHSIAYHAPGSRFRYTTRLEGALSEIYLLESVCDTLNAGDRTSALKCAAARHLLALWQHTKDTWLSGDYVNQLIDDTQDLRECPARVEDLIGLEMPTYREEGSQLVQIYSFPCGCPIRKTAGYRNSKGEFIAHGSYSQFKSDGSLRWEGIFEHGVCKALRE
jgi:hypothetical protein